MLKFNINIEHQFSKLINVILAQTLSLLMKLVKCLNRWSYVSLWHVFKLPPSLVLSFSVFPFLQHPVIESARNVVVMQKAKNHKVCKPVLFEHPEIVALCQYRCL